jgi:hypothetical protein
MVISYTTTKLIEPDFYQETLYNFGGSAGAALSYLAIAISALSNLTARQHQVTFSIVTQSGVRQLDEHEIDQLMESASM